MIENAVASTLMRLPVAELSALRKIFKASPGGLSVEGFVEAMLPPGPRHVPAAVAASDSSLASISVISRLNFEGLPINVGRSSRRQKAKKRRRRSIGSKRRGQKGVAPGKRHSTSKSMSALARHRSVQNRLRLKRGANRGENDCGDRGSGDWDSMIGGCSLTEAEKVAMVADLVELFQQVDHNGDKVMEWDEFTGFVIDQVLALTRETPHEDRLKQRQLGAHDKAFVAKLPVRKVRYVPQLGRILACVGPVVQAWDPCMRPRQAKRDGVKRTEAFLAISPVEEVQGFEHGSSAAILEEDGKTRMLGTGANPTRNRGAPVVFAMDVKYIEAKNLLMVLRSDLSLAFFAGDTYVRVALVKTSSQQYVLEYCPVTGLAFTSGCDGAILPFSIDTDYEAVANDTQPGVRVTVTQVGALKRHSDIVQDLLAVSGSEAECGQRLISCGLDRAVYVWDIEKGSYVQSKHGNRAAIRSLAFDPGDNLLLGAGMEGEVLAWDLWGKLGSPLFRLQGHRSPIYSVSCAPGKGRAASVDETGKIVLWDTRRNTAVDLSERYMCHVDAGDNHPTSLDIVSGEGDEFLRWSHIGVSVVTTGRKLRIYDAVDPRASEPPLSTALYSCNCMSFVTCNGPFVTVWDACTGKAIRLDRACDGDIVRATLDAGQRRLVLGSSTGEIVVFGFLQGIHIRSMTPRHKGPVSGLAYVAEDQVVVSGGWDRSLRVYDEIPREGDPPLLRKVDGAHSSDINCVVVSRHFSLIASGSAGGSCRLWDLQFLSCEGSCTVGHEVQCMCFLEPYPLLAVGDSGGYISVIPVRSWLGKGLANDVGLRFVNDREGEGTIEGPATVTCMTFRSSSTQAPTSLEMLSGNQTDTFSSETNTSILYTGDDKQHSSTRPLLVPGIQGIVRVWDISEALARIGCHAVPQGKLPTYRNNYDVRRRFHKQAGSTRGRISSDDDGLAVDVLREGEDEREALDRSSAHSTPFPEQHTDTSDALLIGQWSPHSETVVSLQVIDDPLCLLTASRDRSVKLRALPNDGGFANDQSATTSTDQSIGETTITAVTKSRLSDIGGGSSGNSNSNSINDNNFNDINSHNTPLAVLSTEIPNDRGTTQTHILASRSAAGVTDNANYGKEVGNCSSRASLEQHREDPRGEHAGSALESATSCVGSLQVSTSTSNASSTYRYGRHLSTLTLGRIADGFRRDCHVFPVDLKGRGEGRAVEARAVMQALEEIERRRENRKKDEAALQRTREYVANAKSTSATVKTTLAATPSAAVDGLNEGEDGQVNQSKGVPEPPMEASTTAESSTSACVVTRRSVSESVELEYIAPVPATTNLAGSTVGPESPPLIGTSEQVAITSTACPKKAATAMTDGPTVGANDHVQQRPVLDSHHKPLLLPEDDITNNVNEGSCKTGKILQTLPRGEDSQNLPGKVHNKLLGAMSMYENMSLEVLRLKKVEAASKRALRCGDAEIAIRNLLKPSPFLLGQMPEIVSSCSAATGLFKDKDNNYSSGTSNNSKSNHSNRAFKTESVAKTSGTTFSQRSVLPLSEHPANTVEPTPSKVPPVRMLTSSRGDRERLPGKLSDHGADEILRVKVEESREHAAGGSTAATFTNGNACLECVHRGQPTLVDFSTASDMGVAVHEKRDGVRRIESPTASVGVRQGESDDDKRVLRHDEMGDQRGQVSLWTAPEHDTERVTRSLPRQDVGSTETVPEHDTDTFAETSMTTQARPGYEERTGCKNKAKHHGDRKILAKVNSQRRLKHSPPESTSFLSKFGPASRWGELSKSHLKFRRLGTAQLLQSISCPSLSKEFAASVTRRFPFRMTEREREMVCEAATLHRDHRRALCPSYSASAPFHAADVDDLARRHERAQASWKKRVEAFQAGKNGLSKNERRRVHNIGSSSPSGHSFATKKRPRHVGESARKPNHNWRYKPKSEEEQDGDPETTSSALKARKKFGPYSTSELELVWKRLDAAVASGGRVDARLLFGVPLLRDNRQYRRQMPEVLGSTNGRSSTVVPKQDAFRKLLPALDRSEAKAFFLLMKLKEKEEARRRGGRNTSKLDVGELGEEDSKPDHAKEKELRALFALYDIDRSGFVDVEEIVAALRVNQTAQEVAAGMGDAVTEAEVAALVSQLSNAGDSSQGEGGSGSRRDIHGMGDAGKQQLDFHGFCRLFADVL